MAATESLENYKKENGEEMAVTIRFARLLPHICGTILVLMVGYLWYDFPKPLETV